MTKLTGIKAFEARWQSLKNSQRASGSDSILLMQAMGRLVDNYATREEIVQELPHSLKGAFDRLVDAYLNGFWAEDEPEKSESGPESVAVSPAMLAATQLRQRRKAQPTESSEAATYITNDTLEQRSGRAFSYAGT